MFPHRHLNFLPIYIESRGLFIVVDLLDFETYQHTIPGIWNGSSEMILQDMLLNEGKVFLDIGANQGIFSLHASKLAGQRGRVIAVEPQPRLAEALRGSKQVNQFGQLKVVEAAAGNRCGQTSFFIPSTSSGIGSIIKSHASQGHRASCITVHMTSVDQIVEDTGLTEVDLIKVDVEGSEIEVFQGARNTLLNHKPFVWFEVNPISQQLAGLESSSLVTFLADFSYVRFLEVVSLANGFDREVRTFHKLTNVLAIHENRLAEFKELIRRYRARHDFSARQDVFKERLIVDTA